MKTYSEKMGKKTFNWFDAIEKMRSGEIKDDSKAHWNLIRWSKDWVTCACGNQDARIKRGEDGAPIDDELRMLGLIFHGDIEWFRPNDALDILHTIEARSAELLKEIKP